VSDVTAPVGVASRALPSGWRWAALGDTCEIVIGRTPRRDSPEYWSGTLPWVTISDLNDDVVTDTRERITTLGVRASGARLLASGTLLFSFKLTIGKMAVAGVDLYTNEAIAGLVPRAGVQLSIEYLRYALSAVNVSSGSSHAVKGRTLNLPLLRAIRVPLPPLPEQRRIAAALREQLDAAARIRAAAGRIRGVAEALRYAHVREVFESPPCSTVATATIGEVSSLVMDGPHVTPQYVDSGVPFITVQNIVGRMIDFTHTRFITPADHRSFSRRGSAEVGDVLYTKDGTLGIPCLVDDARDFSFFVSVALIKPRRDLVNSRYVAYALESPAVLSQVEQLGAGAGLKHMVLKSIRSINVPMPPLRDQERLADELDGRLNSVRRLQGMTDTQAAEIGRLPATLLRRAFLSRD